jgi:hypothetical protein
MLIHVCGGGGRDSIIFRVVVVNTPRMWRRKRKKFNLWRVPVLDTPAHTRARRRRRYSTAVECSFSIFLLPERVR